MNTDDFNAIVQAQIERSTSVLIKKADEYASDTDRLANFKVAASLQGITDIQALAGMMAKHTQSVYAMIWDGKPHSREMWEEKITDSINYLLLLTAVVSENMMPEFLIKDVMPAEDYQYQLPDLEFTTKKDAEAVLGELQTLINNYGEAAGGDALDLAKLPSTFKDSLYGWKELTDSNIIRLAKGYRLVLPQAILLRNSRGGVS